MGDARDAHARCVADWRRRRRPRERRARASVERDLATEVNSRRTFAIISHPDAGKTTLTEKLLYYGGAIQEAGAVRARRGAKAATSDWMEMEKQRGAFCSSHWSPYDRVRVVNFIP